MATVQEHCHTSLAALQPGLSLPGLPRALPSVQAIGCVLQMRTRSQNPEVLVICSAFSELTYGFLQRLT